MLRRVLVFRAQNNVHGIIGLPIQNVSSQTTKRYFQDGRSFGQSSAAGFPKAANSQKQQKQTSINNTNTPKSFAEMTEAERLALLKSTQRENKWAKPAAPLEVKIPTSLGTKSPAEMTEAERLALLKSTQKENKWAKPAAPLEIKVPPTLDTPQTSRRSQPAPHRQRTSSGAAVPAKKETATTTTPDVVPEVDVDMPLVIETEVDERQEAQTDNPWARRKQLDRERALRAKSKNKRQKELSRRDEDLDEGDEMFDLPDEDEDIPKSQQKKSAKAAEPKPIVREVFIPDMISVANLGRLLGLRAHQLARVMHSAGLQETAHDHLLTADEASLVVIELGYSPVVNNEAAFDLFPRPRPEDMSVYPLRPPVVTVMGHVDHGKTSLLDALRKTSVAAGEAGGITQHIGAFSVLLPSKQRITFLDTPGHAAFCAMRARGAQITDIVVLVVAADDGVMPQTIEAIQHAQAANVPIVVAINKCDKPNIDIKRVKEELLRYNVQLEEYGGDVQAVEVSALTGAGLDALEESILVQAELLDIRAETDIPAEGFVLESGVDKGLGNVATVLVKRGTLKRGDTIIAGTSYGRVRTMTTDQGENVVQAGPGTPVKVTGWKELPMAGDELLVAESEEQAKKAAHNRYERLERQKELKALEEINEKRRLMRDANAASDEASASNVTKSQVPELPIVLKGDVSGSVEAVVGALAGLPSNKARIRVIQTGVGPISESDVDMAAAAKGIVLGFNVKCDKRVQQHARAHQVSVSTHNIIYRLLEDAKRRLVDLLPVEYEPTVTGEARILQIFTITLKGRMTTNVAGCRVMNGVMKRNERFRILRNGEIIFDGSLSSLKHVKKDITEATKGLECGMSFENFEDIQVDDVIQSYRLVEKPRSL